MRIILVDLLKSSKILVDFLSFLEKSVEFFVPNTHVPEGGDWRAVPKPIYEPKYKKNTKLNQFWLIFENFKPKLTWEHRN